VPGNSILRGERFRIQSLIAERLASNATASLHMMGHYGPQTQNLILLASLIDSKSPFRDRPRKSKDVKFGRTAVEYVRSSISFAGHI